MIFNTASRRLAVSSGLYSSLSIFFIFFNPLIRSEVKVVWLMLSQRLAALFQKSNKFRCICKIVLKRQSHLGGRPSTHENDIAPGTLFLMLK